MRTTALPLSAALSIVAAASAVAQPTSPQPGQEIVVEGTRGSDRQIRDFVKALTDAPSFGQIGRFHSAVCPAAMGLLPVQNAALAARMRAVAAAAGVGVAPAGCTPNTFVIVAPDKRAAIRELYRRYPTYFAGLTSKQIASLAAAPEPATAWQISTLLSAEGEILKKAGGSGHYILENSNAPSRVRAATIPAFVASMVVIDRRSASGLSVTQLADYAAMRTFADTTPTKAAGVRAPSILTILDEAPDQLVPVTLTHWDLAFLKSLYATSNAYYAAYQRGDMERVVSKELKRRGAERRP